jgi:hypothetical protein
MKTTEIQCGMCGDSFTPGSTRSYHSGSFCSSTCEAFWNEWADREFAEISRAKSLHQVPDDIDAAGALAGIRAEFDECLEHKHTEVFKKDFCGRFSIRGSAFDNTHTKYSRVNCKCWNCKRCAPKRAKLYRRSICREIEKHKLCRMLTLTLDMAGANIGTADQRALYKKHFKSKLQCPCDSCANLRKKSVPYIRDCFNKLRTYWRRQYGKAPTFIAVLEFQQNGNPHLHVVVDRYMDQSWLQAAWQAVGGGRFVNIEHFDLHRAAHYISKYLSKDDYAKLFSAPLRARRVTTSRSIKLLEKPEKLHLWELLRTTITELFSRFESTATGIVRDALDSELMGFAVPLTT